jgi:hypothetical protein
MLPFSQSNSHIILLNFSSTSLDFAQTQPTYTSQPFITKMSNHPVHPPIRTNDPNTIIALHGFISGVPAFRIPASNIPTFTALCVATYSAFQNEVEEYRLHFHFRQDVPCDERELLEREKWDAGAYFIGGSIDIYAHFMRRDNLGGAGEMGVMIQRGVGVGRRSPPLSSLARFPLTSYSVGRGYSSRAGASTRRMNLDSTTVYSLGMVMPNKWYPGVKYFSAPYVFIPDLGARARMVSRPPRPHYPLFFTGENAY